MLESVFGTHKQTSECVVVGVHDCIRVVISLINEVTKYQKYSPHQDTCTEYIPVRVVRVRCTRRITSRRITSLWKNSSISSILYKLINIVFHHRVLILAVARERLKHVDKCSRYLVSHFPLLRLFQSLCLKSEGGDADLLAYLQAIPWVESVSPRCTRRITSRRIASLWKTLQFQVFYISLSI